MSDTPAGKANVGRAGASRRPGAKALSRYAGKGLGDGLHMGIREGLPATWVADAPLPRPAFRHCRQTVHRRCTLRGLAWHAPHFTSWLILKIGRMIDIAMKPTKPPMTTIISGSIMLVTL